MKILKSRLPIVIAYRFVLEELSDRLLQRITSSPSRSRTGKGLILSSPAYEPIGGSYRWVASFTPRLKAFQKLKEISLEKCDWLRLFHPIQQRSVRSLHLLPFSLSSPLSPSRATIGNGVDPPQLSPARRKERRGRERRGREAA